MKDSRYVAKLYKIKKYNIVTFFDKVDKKKPEKLGKYRNLHRQKDTNLTDTTLLIHSVSLLFCLASIPDWHDGEMFKVEAFKFPPDVYNSIQPGKKFDILANLSANDYSDLCVELKLL